MSRDNVIYLEIDEEGKVNKKKNIGSDSPFMNINNNDKINIEEVLWQINENLLHIASGLYNNGGNGGGNMDLETRVSRLEEKTNSIETIVARIDERTQRLENMETSLVDLQKDLKDFKNEILKGETLATKDFVRSEINGVKNWIIVTALGTGIAIVRLFMM